MNTPNITEARHLFVLAQNQETLSILDKENELKHLATGQEVLKRLEAIKGRDLTDLFCRLVEDGEPLERTGQNTIKIGLITVYLDGGECMISRDLQLECEPLDLRELMEVERFRLFAIDNEIKQLLPKEKGEDWTPESPITLSRNDLF